MYGSQSTQPGCHARPAVAGTSISWRRSGDRWPQAHDRMEFLHFLMKHQLPRATHHAHQIWAHIHYWVIHISEPPMFDGKYQPLLVKQVLQWIATYTVYIASHYIVPSLPRTHNKTSNRITSNHAASHHPRRNEWLCSAGHTLSTVAPRNIWHYNCNRLWSTPLRRMVPRSHCCAACTLPSQFAMRHDALCNESWWLQYGSMGLETIWREIGAQMRDKSASSCCGMKMNMFLSMYYFYCNQYNCCIGVNFRDLWFVHK